MKNTKKFALIYDFDKTLSKRNMQDYGFMQSLKLDSGKFWQECDLIKHKHLMDGNLAYMFHMLSKCKECGVKLTKSFLKKCGKSVELLPGVTTWFDRINAFGKKHGFEIEHYLVSSGLKEIVEGTPIAKYFKEIYACSFLFQNGEAVWPARAIDYTEKTQFLYRINKGILSAIDPSINDNMPHEERPIPFTNMIYIGDSDTDIPCMRLVMKSGGNAIAVFQEDEKHIEYLQNLMKNNKVNYITKANYEKDSSLEQLVKDIIENLK